MKEIKANPDHVLKLEFVIYWLVRNNEPDGLFMIGDDLYCVNLNDFRKLKR